MTREDLINQRATTCRHGGHCEWVACDKCNHYEPKPETITNSTSGYLEVVLPECDDCISRQAAIDTIESWLSCDDYNEAERHIMRAMQSVLYDLPPVTPKEKTGHWYMRETYPLECESWECSECKEVVFEKTKFCPNCGAKMEVKNE